MQNFKLCNAKFDRSSYISFIDSTYHTKHYFQSINFFTKQENIIIG